MAYCRPSTDDFCCDVYCYASTGGGYQIHLAGRRLKEPLNLPPRVELKPGDDGKIPREQFEAFFARCNLSLRLMDSAEWVNIDHPWAGKSFWCEDAEDCVAKLREIREAGFNMPAGVEDDVLEDADAVEAAEESQDRN